jgi:low affinity Fe/Cu permease
MSEAERCCQSPAKTAFPRGPERAAPAMEGVPHPERHRPALVEQSTAERRRVSESLPFMATNPHHSRLAQIGCWVSSKVADLAAHPYAQIGVIAVCLAWFAIGLGENALTAALSILAITLTQMVLNQQQARETDAHRRDVALHAKLDELILATHEARDEVAGIEELEVEEITELREAANVTAIAARKRPRKKAKA